MAGADDLSLSVSYFPLTVTTAAATAKATPLSTLVRVPPALLTATDVLIPTGHAGQTGLQLVYSGQVILPFAGATGDQWIVGDGDRETFDFQFPIGGALTVRTFNTGIFAHSHYLRFKVDYNAYTATSRRPALAIVPVA